MVGSDSQELVRTVNLQSSECAQQLQHACSELGMFYLTGHGLPDSFLASVLTSARALFDEASIPPAQRQSVCRHNGGFMRGYIGRGAESGSSTASESGKEGFALGYEWSRRIREGQSPGVGRTQEGDGVDSESGSSVSWSNPLQGENVWPPGLAPQHREHLQQFFRECCSLSRELLKLLAHSAAEKVTESARDQILRICGSIGGDCSEEQVSSAGAGQGPEGTRVEAECQSGTADSRHSSAASEADSISLLRVFRYLEGFKGRVGSSPHTDWGLWTVILQDSHVAGLEVWHRDAWHVVPPVRGTLLVNAGDLLHVLMGGTTKSPLHRVVAQTDEERVSLVFFQYPSFSTRMPVLDASGKESVGADLSLFKNQRAGGESNRTDEEGVGEDLSFGEVILRKWAQVQRAG